MEDGKKILISALRVMLKPLMRFCVRYSLHVQDVLESAKVAMIEAAKEEMERTKQEVNVSRLSVITGMHRRDVMRIYREEAIKEEPRGLVNRVIGQWVKDKRFVTRAGKPQVLSVDGPDSDFKKLCGAISHDLKPGTVLFELERVGAVEHTPRGLKLLSRSYVTKGNVKETMVLLSRDTADLITAASENAFSPQEVPNLHAKTEYDNVDPDAVPKIRQWVLQEGTVFHTKMRNFLSNFDRDINPERRNNRKGVRVAVGTFGLVTDD